MATFRNFIAGYDSARRQRQEDIDRKWQEAERQYQAERRATVDQRQDTTWEQGQEDRARTLRRDAQEYPYHFRNLINQAEMGDVQLGTARFQADRLPTVAKQQDELHGQQMANHEQLRRIRNAQEGRASAMHGLQLSAAQLQAEHQRFVHQMAPALHRFDATGDPSVIAGVWRNVLGDESPGDLVALDDGKYAITDESGEPLHVFQSKDETSRFIAGFLQDPQMLAQVLMGVDQSGNAPSRIREAQIVARHRDDPAFMEAYSMVAPSVGKRSDPLPLLQREYQNVRAENTDIRGNLRPGVTEEDIMAEAERRIGRLMESAQRYGLGRALQQQGAPAAQDQPGATQYNPVPVSSREEVAALPPGTWVQLPNGYVRQR